MFINIINDKINIIREKCIAVNPEIKQCDCRCHNGKQVFRAEGGICLDCKCLPHERICRPIHLADVLLAIEAISESSKEGWSYRVWADSEFQINDGFSECETIWNLRAADLEQQSEETINFLYELLK